MASTAGHPSASETLARFYEAEARYSSVPSDGNWNALGAFLDPDFILFQAESLPYGGIWRGPDGFRAWMKAMGDFRSHFSVAAVRIFEGPDVVVIQAMVTGTARKTGRDIEMPVAQIVTLRDGRLLEVRPFYWDTAATRQALVGGDG